MSRRRRQRQTCRSCCTFAAETAVEGGEEGEREVGLRTVEQSGAAEDAALTSRRPDVVV